MRPPGLMILILLPLLTIACRSTPRGSLPRPRGEVTPRTGEKPHRLTVAPIVPDRPDLRKALDMAGVGLRVAGDRQGLVLRYAALDPAAESVLLRTLGLEESFSRPVRFAGSDAIEISSMTRAPSARGFILHLVPQGGLKAIDVGVIARPPNGALLPVIRGTVPISGTGSVLLVGEAEGLPAFAALVRLELEGTGRVGRVSEPRSHRLEIEPYVLANAALSRLLARFSLQERGGAGGIAEYLIRARELPALRESLAGEGEKHKTGTFTVGPNQLIRWNRGALRLDVSTRFSLTDFSYETRLTSRPPRKVNHGEDDAILVVGWDAERPGRSVAAVLRFHALE